MWRVKDWEDILDKIDPTLLGYEKARELIEAGADAMLKSMVKWIHEQDEMTCARASGDEVECFFVPTQALQELEK